MHKHAPLHISLIIRYSVQLLPLADSATFSYELTYQTLNAGHRDGD